MDDVARLAWLPRGPIQLQARSHPQVVRPTEPVRCECHKVIRVTKLTYSTRREAHRIV